jgi:sugar lactone lactonase YvrE
MKKLFLFLSVACLAACSKSTTSTPASLNSGSINTVAGDGVYGYSGDGGAATAAELNYPGGVAVDGNGNIYIADGSNNCIRMVNSKGIISTVAGNGGLGYSGDGGPATAAQLNGPAGVAVDSSGNLYIADENNDVIRKVGTNGIITTFAGNGTGGFGGDNGAAVSARLSLPSGVATDKNGNVYIADMANQRVRKVDIYGTITTVAGNGTGTGTGGGAYGGDGGAATAAELSNPVAIAVDASGTLYIADMSNNRVRMVSASGTISTLAGNGNGGFGGDSSAATSAALHFPTGVAADGNDNVYISDSYNQRVRKVSGGLIHTYAGNGNPAGGLFTGSYGGDGGPAAQSQLFNPRGLATDAAGNVYIADQQNNRIRKVNK